MKRDIATEIKAFLSDERKMLLSGQKAPPIQIRPPERPQEKSLVVIE
jgi:hypothetical protein